MADEEGFDIRRDLPVFLASVLDKTESICQNDEGEGAAEAHAEVIDQSIRMLRSIRDCRDIGTRKEPHFVQHWLLFDASIEGATEKCLAHHSTRAGNCY